MFGRQRAKKLKEAQRHLDVMMQEVEKLKSRPMLIGINRKGRMNTFIFMKGSEMHQIETMGLLSDNLDEWKKILE